MKYNYVLTFTICIVAGWIKDVKKNREVKIGKNLFLFLLTHGWVKA